MPASAARDDASARRMLLTLTRLRSAAPRYAQVKAVIAASDGGAGVGAAPEAASSLASAASWLAEDGVPMMTKAQAACGCSGASAIVLAQGSIESDIGILCGGGGTSALALGSSAEGEAARPPWHGESKSVLGGSSIC